MKTFESELGRIPDVLAVRSVEDGDARREVHVLASPGRRPTDIAGDVESLAVLRGIELATDGIHVVQLQPVNDDRPIDETASTSPADGGAEDEAPSPPSDGRPEIDGVLVITGEGASRAVVTVRLGAQVATGTAVFVPAGSAARRGVAEAALTAVLELVGTRLDVAVDSALLLQVPPHEVALVALAEVSGAGEDILIGAVPVRSGGANEALARAVLDGTSRWFARHGSSPA